MERNREDYQRIIDESNAQFMLMDKTAKNMDIAREMQQVLLDYAEKKIKKFPEVVKTEETPEGVG